MEISRRLAENRRKAEVQGSVPYKGRGKIHAGTKSNLVGTIANLTESIARLPGVKGFKAYICSNSSNPVEMYSLLDPEPCMDVVLDYVVERILCGEILQINRERLIRII